MPLIELKYGKSSFPLEYSNQRFEILDHGPGGPALSDAELGDKLDLPLDSPPLEEIVEPGNSVLLVVPDATRQTAAGQVVNLLVRRLIAAGVAPFDIRIIFATGIHRKVTTDERASILTPFINQRIKTLDHDPRDLARIVRLGETAGGVPVELDRALLEHDRVILVGGISFHYFAGFTGGRKLICPGLASSRTVAETHKLAFDFDKRRRRFGVDTGRLEGNAVHEAFVEAAGKAPPSFCINAIVDDAGDATDLYCGHWLKSHEAACKAYARQHTVAIKERRQLVIASCGGYPYDINMIQAHKALDTAARACEEGGQIVLLAECADGLGRADFLAWFTAEDSRALAVKLVEKYQVNGQTAWSLLEKAERYSVSIVTSLPDEVTTTMRLEKIDFSSLASLAAADGKTGYIIPAAAKITVQT